MNDHALQIILSAKNTTDKAFKDVQSGLGGIDKAAGIAKKALGGLVAGFTLAAVVKGIDAVVGAANTQIEAETKLENIIRSTGQAAGFTAGQLIAYAGELQRVTAYGDELTISAQAILATFTNIGGDVFKRTMVSAMDLSTLLGQDLQSSVLMLGKSLNAPVQNLGALSRAGIQFSNEQKVVIKSLVESNRLAEAQGVILNELERQFGGVSKAVRSTFSGAMQGARNALGDVLEQLGFFITKNDAFVSAINSIEQAFVRLGDALKGPSLEEQLQKQKEQLEKLRDMQNNTKPEKNIPDIQGFHQKNRDRLLSGGGDIGSNRDYSDVYSYKPDDNWLELEIQKTMEAIARTEELIRKQGEAAAGPQATTGGVYTGADYSAMYSGIGGPDSEQMLKSYYDSLKREDEAFWNEWETTLDRRGEEIEPLYAGIGDAYRRIQDNSNQTVDQVLDDARQMSEALRDAFESFSDYFAGVLADLAMGADMTFEDIMKSFTKMMIQMAIQKSMSNLFNSVWPSTTTNAHGNAYDSGGLVPFASGGVVDKPTLFAFASGIGLMGEAGAEAILPLKRLSNGDLGVQTAPTKSEPPSVEFHLHNESGEQMNVSKSKQRFDGQKIIVEAWMDAYTRNAYGMRNAIRK